MLLYVEHAIRVIKRKRIAAVTFHNTSAGMTDLSFEVVAGLINLTNTGQSQQPELPNRENDRGAIRPGERVNYIR